MFVLTFIIFFFFVGFLDVVDIMGNFGYNRFKAEDFGLEPNVTGFEEEINLAYLDGRREGRYKAERDTVCNLINLGFGEKFISKATGIGPDKIRYLIE